VRNAVATLLVAAVVTTAGAAQARGPAFEIPLDGGAPSPSVPRARSGGGPFPWVGERSGYRRFMKLIDWLSDDPLHAAELVRAGVKQPLPSLERGLALGYERRDDVEDAIAAWQKVRETARDLRLVAEAERRLRLLRAELERARARPVHCPDDRPALFAVTDAEGRFAPEREPLVVVHGYGGTPLDLQALVARFRATRQVYVVCYESERRTVYQNGRTLAQALLALERQIGRGRDLTIVAHSLGGIVTRLGLAYLKTGRGLHRFGTIDVYAVDTPWHGYVGPSDRGFDRVLFGLVRPIFPDGARDMRSRSALFEGDPEAADPVARAGLFGIALPDSVRLHILFAADGDVSAHYGRGFLRPFVKKLVGLYARDEEIASPVGDGRVRNYWRALLESSSYGAMQAEARELADAGRLDEAAMLAILERHYPIFPGDHMTVLAEHAGPGPSFLEHLGAALAAADRARPPRPTIAAPTKRSTVRIASR
jgi:hypothetical protein